LSKTKVIQNAIESFVKRRNIERLRLLNEILSKGILVPEEYFSDVMRKPLQELYSEQDSEEKKLIVRSLAKKLSIELLEDNEKENGKGG